MKCIEDEIPFEIPDGWAWERLSNIASFSGGKTPSTSVEAFWGNDVLWVTSKDMKNKYIDSSIMKLSKLGAEQLQVYAVNTLLLVVRSGILRHSLPVAILKAPATVNQDLKAISLYYDGLEEYIYVCLKGMESTILHTYTKAGATVENINFDAFQRILIPMAPQSKIPTIIENVQLADKLIYAVDKNSASLCDDIAQAKSKILDLAIRGQLVLQNPADEPASVLLERIRAEKEELIKAGKIKRDKKESVIFKGEDNSYYRNDGKNETCIDNELPFAIPESWTWCSLSMIGSTNIGLTYKPTDICKEGIMVLRSSNIVDGQIDLTDLVRVSTPIRPNQYMEPNDILICARNGSKALVGKCAVFENIPERASFGAFMAVYRSSFYRYVYYYLNTDTFKDTFKNDDSKQINQLTQDMIKNTLIPLPPQKEQDRITSTISKLFEQIDRIVDLVQ